MQTLKLKALWCVPKQGRCAPCVYIQGKRVHTQFIIKKQIYKIYKHNRCVWCVPINTLMCVSTYTTYSIYYFICIYRRGKIRYTPYTQTKLLRLTFCIFLVFWWTEDKPNRHTGYPRILRQTSRSLIKNNFFCLWRSDTFPLLLGFTK